MWDMEQGKESIVSAYGDCGHLLVFSSIAVKEITSKFSILKQPLDFATNFVVQNSGRAQKVFMASHAVTVICWLGLWASKYLTATNVNMTHSQGSQLGCHPEQCNKASLYTLGFLQCGNWASRGETQREISRQPRFQEVGQELHGFFRSSPGLHKCHFPWILLVVRSPQLQREGH